MTDAQSAYHGVADTVSLTKLMLAQNSGGSSFDKSKKAVSHGGQTWRTVQETKPSTTGWNDLSKHAEHKAPCLGALSCG